MSDSDESGVTHTEISSPFEDLSDIGSPRVAPPSPDYIPGREEPQSPPLPDFVPELVYPEYMPQKDEVFPAEEQPLPAAASPTAQSPDYVPDDDEDESSEDYEDDDEVDIEADDDDEEEEHPDPTDSAVVALPAVDQAPSAEETESFETDESVATPPPHPAYCVTARISIPAPVPTPVWSDAEVARLLAISTPPSSPLSPCPIHPLGYRAAMIRLRAEAASTSHSLPLPPPIILSHTRPAAPSSGTPPLHLLSTDCREDRPEVTLPLRKREIRHDPERDVGYGITDLWDEIVETLQGAPVSTDTELGRHMTAFETRVRQDMDEIYETEARMSREPWGRSIDAGDLTRAEVMSLRTTVLAQQSQIRELQSADHRRQTMITEMLAADHRRQKQLTEALKLIMRLQTQMAEFERQQGPAKGPAQPELPEEAGSSS
ncbi:hypothetical protein Tco_1326377 [Tanacetum coccineum]